jgi:beta-lactamase superfamily II metal-dependent hydrolase
VLLEASAAQEQETLVPARIADVKPPFEFKRTHAADLIGWSGDAGDPKFSRLLQDLESRARIRVRRSAERPDGDQDAREERNRESRRKEALRRRQARALAIVGVLAALTLAVVAWRTGGSEPQPPTPTQANGPIDLDLSSFGGDMTIIEGAEFPPRESSNRNFTLEVFDAGFGDSLLLHFGDRENPNRILVNGGPSGAFATTILPRLEQLRRRLSGDSPLPLEALVVTDNDDDKIRGVLDLFALLRDGRQSGAAPPIEIRRLWFNSFDDTPGNSTGLRGPPAVLAALGPAIEPLGKAAAGSWTPVSVRQARELRGLAEALGVPINEPWGRHVVVAEGRPQTISLPGGMRATVVGPSVQSLKGLEEFWDGNLARYGLASPAAYADKSATNLASISMVFEVDGKRVLLPGDSRGDLIIEGLASAGLLTGGPSGVAHFDLMQLPHYGSDRNVTRGFFETVQADVYLIGGNGRFNNPESSTLSMVTQARGDDSYTILFTHPDGENELRARLDAFFESERALKRNYHVMFRSNRSSSIRINLLDPLAL